MKREFGIREIVTALSLEKASCPEPVFGEPCITNTGSRISYEFIVKPTFGSFFFKLLIFNV